MPHPLPRCISFDVDGVLLDSLPQHLQICRDLAERYGLNLTIPSIAEMRARISAGLVVSPMRQFFLALGFTESLAERGLDEYRRNFASRYPPRPFPGVREMLLKIYDHHIRLGLVTSNIRENVIAPLSDCASLFDPQLMFFDEPSTTGLTKEAALSRSAELVKVNGGDCYYVGDQPADERAARAAGFYFLGVTYGWGITGAEGRFPIARNVGEIADFLLREAILAV